MLKTVIKPRISLQNPLQIWFVLLAICLVNFMFNFYIGLVNVCLPTITEFFGSSVMTATWISNIYLICLTISVIFLGRIGGMWSRKKFFMIGTLIWVFSSFACYFAPSPDMLILIRGIQGFSAGFMASVYYAILDKTFPRKDWDWPWDASWLHFRGIRHRSSSRRIYSRILWMANNFPGSYTFRSFKHLRIPINRSKTSC